VKGPRSASSYAPDIRLLRPTGTKPSVDQLGTGTAVPTSPSNPRSPHVDFAEAASLVAAVPLGVNRPSPRQVLLRRSGLSGSAGPVGLVDDIADWRHLAIDALAAARAQRKRFASI
jgi:hypothetical protein